MLPFPKSGPCPSDEDLSRYLAKTLASERREPVEAHLASCEECLDVLLDARRATEAAESAELADHVALRVRGRRGSARSVLRRGRRPRPLLHMAAAAAVLASVSALVVFVSMGGRRASDTTAHGPGEQRPGEIVTPSESGARGENRTEKRVVPETPKPEPRTVEGKEPETPPSPEVPAPPPEETPEEAPPDEKAPEPPPQREPVPPTRAATAIALQSVHGRVAWRGRDAKSGDEVSLQEPLRTGFGAHAVLGAGGAKFVLHQQTELALGPGPMVRLSSGRLFVRSAPGLRVETPAGTIVPIGTEFSVEVLDATTRVAVREGTVQFGNDHGKAEVKKGRLLVGTASKAPGATAAVPDPEEFFAWASPLGTGKYLVLYPGSRKTGVVVSAAHAHPWDKTRVAQFAAGVSERLGVGCVSGYGTTRWSTVVAPGKTKEDRELFERYVRLVREVAGERPAKLIVVFQEKPEGDRFPQIAECGAVGFTREEQEKMKQEFAAILQRRAFSVPLRMVCNLTDPKYEVDGKKVTFGPNVSDLKANGIFKGEFTARGLLVRVPRTCRYDDRIRSEAEAIFAEWIARLK